ncbi:1,4-dihydroxy-2-naphthoate polyprenyltransferase [Spiractinospora alimapuensis]|uniref:1,4-dihydroxy-2-naphthoate polyprenyltransferase n=1 Tax=Spiractinospora alimapuensis TaxID=2820884 RepID=UPI001EEBE176|nr:1,4-dihydroxy-2-naphthoate polyprenyltransferase [Spiractinospora alimapuensis]QVQ53648.1 1,4-dihydroxy-2-naphthoate polyprenyltransferase [Spiractinospora alimapuensis]
MATVTQWVAGARPRTLPSSVVPVVVGTAAAFGVGALVWWKAGLAMLVALALQVGVNYANDYSDGVRGTDDDRVGPFRMTGSGAAPPRQVLTAAWATFAVGAAAGIVLVVTSAWWLLLVGAAAILAAWYYTGGKSPYGYRALGEASVFVFFGPVAVVGTVFVQTAPDGVPGRAWLAGAAVGLLICAMLVINNLRDIPTDAESGKRTLAVVLGDTRTRALYVGTIVGAVLLAMVSLLPSWWSLSLLLVVPFALAPVSVIWRGETGRALIPALGQTGRLQLVFGVLYSVGLALA